MATQSTEAFMMEDSYSSSKRKPAYRMYIIYGVVIAVSIGLGVIIGYFSKSTPACECPAAPCVEAKCLDDSVPDNIKSEADESITQMIIDNVDPERIRENLRSYTTYPHLAGTEGEEILAQELYDTWMNQGLDYVTKNTYDILLSYPDRDDPSFIFLYDENGTEVFRTQPEEKILVPSMNHSDVVPPFNSYSPPGDVEGDLLYVNYARVEDFMYLRDNMSIDFSNCIVIARYGKIFRGDKARLAEEYGAKGIFMYTDPADYTIEGVDPYPDSWWLPETGVQRGTVFADDGDPLTPGYPSIDSAYRWDIENVTLPKIPVHPISYGDAKHFLEQMKGSDSPEDWKGGIDGVDYKIGPGFINDGWTVKMHITTDYQRANSSNVFGIIEGSVEPDRYILMGNHRDAWVFGAMDPTCGTATMMEVSRVMMEAVKTGWRPRRSIMFCSWGAEEYGLIGSYEFVEEHIKNLVERSVAVINLDMAFNGNHSIRALGVPILYDVIYEVSKKIKTPNTPGETLYDEWIRYFPKPDGTDPRIGSLGSGSDYAPFMNFAGIPAMDVRYTYSDEWDIASYPLYHSAYETFHLVENYVDPEFKYSAAIAQFSGEMARHLADAYVLPLNVVSYGEAIVSLVKDLDDGYGDLMRENGVELDDLTSAADMFRAATNTFADTLSKANKHNPVEVRALNDQIMLLERAFTDPAGLPLRPLYKHLLFAPSTHDSYAGATFPGLVDLMFEIEKYPERWEDVKRHLSVVIFTIQSAASTLRPVTQFN